MIGTLRTGRPLLALIVLAAMMAALSFTPTAAADPSVIVVPGPGGSPQPAYNADSTLLKAISRESDPGCGDAVRYWDWTIAGSAETTTPAPAPSDPASKTASKEQTLTPAPDGTTKDGSATAHYENGAEPSDDYQVIHKGISKDVDIEKSVLEGLWFLHQDQTRYDQDGDKFGYWGTLGTEVAPTARAVLALEVQGHLPNADPNNYAYSYAAERGLNHLLARLVAVPIGPQPAGDPDSNANGIGLSCLGGEEMMQQPLVLTALAASLDPDHVATVGGPGVAGRTYRDVARDMVDYIAWAQVEDPAPGGAWGTLANLAPSRNSVSQYPILALLAAEENLGVTAPAWVKSELEPWLTYSQDMEPGAFNGGFGDTGPLDYPNIDKTGGGLVGHAYLGTSPLDPRVTAATDFIDRSWSGGGENLGNYYAMYSTQKGLRTLKPEIAYVGAHDWSDEYSDYLIDNQEADGGWPAGPGTDRLGNTSLSILVQTPSIFEPRPVALARTDTAEIITGDGVTFDASTSVTTDPRRTIAKYEWDFDADGTFDYETTDPNDRPTHTYSPDPSECPKSYLARLRVTEDGDRPRTDRDTVEVIVYEPPEVLDTTLTAPEPGGTIYEGDEVELRATLDYPDYMNPTAMIDWDDGSPLEPATITHNSTATARGNHTFSDNASGTARLDVLFNPPELAVRKSVPWTAENRAPEITPPPSVEPSPSAEGTRTLVRMPFADAGEDDTHTAMIDWGDGTGSRPATVTSQPGGSVDGTVTAEHVYADDGSYEISVTVTDDDGGMDLSGFVEFVDDVALIPIDSPDPSLTTTEGVLVDYIGICEDPGVNDNYSGEVSWGDGTPSEPATITKNSPVTVRGSHVYATPGIYETSMTVRDIVHTDNGVTWKSVVTVKPLSEAGHVYVDAARGSDTTGTGSFMAPYKSVTKGMAEASADTTVQVAAGTYSTPTTGDTFPIELKSSVVLQGAGSGDTTLSGTGACEVVRADGVNAAAKIDGFAITGGGGGGGGGIVCVNANPTISHTRVTGNSSNNAGGILVTGASSPMIIENTVTANTGVWGGGIRAQGGAPTIYANTIRGNWATNGGGLAITDGTATVTNNVVSDNKGQRCAGLYLGNAGASTISCNTIVANNTVQADPGGSGILRENSFGGTISNCVIRDNTVATFWLDDLRDVYPTYSNISTPDDTAGVGNISADPLFVDEAGGDYHLSPGSPCIDSGNAATSPGIDKDAVERPQDGDGDGNSLPDMGAYEPPYMYLSGGAAYSSTTDVTMTSFFTNATGMRYRIDGGLWSIWDAYARNLRVRLPATEGTHTMEVEYRYNIFMTKRCSDTIFLDLSPVMRLTTSARLVSYGGSPTLTSTLDTSAGPLAGRGDVTLWRKRSGETTFTREATATYDPTRTVYSVKTVCTRTTVYRMRFDPATLYASAVSNDVTVSARCYLPRPWLVPSTPTRNRAFYVYGYLKPRHYGYNVRLYIYRYYRGRWRFVALRYPRSYDYLTYTRYRLLFRLPYAGRYYVKAYHADASHATTWSSYRYFSVR